MIRITAYAEDDIEDVSALEVERDLKSNGYNVQRTRVTRLTEKQFKKAIGE